MFDPNNLANFYGTENHFLHWTGYLKYTDGIQYIGSDGGFWLIDLVASYQKETKVKREEFQLWKLEKLADNSWLVTMRQDTGTKPIASQKIEFSDFPMNEFEFYVCNGVMLLKSEY